MRDRRVVVAAGLLIGLAACGTSGPAAQTPQLRLSGPPLSCAGLSKGDVWVDATDSYILKVCASER